MQGISPTEAAMPLTPEPRDLIARRCICCNSQNLAKAPAVLMPFVAYRVFGHEPLEILPEWGFRDLRPGMAYTLCNSLQCRECGLLFLDYRFTDAQMAALYTGYRDERYTRERDRFEPGYGATAARGFENRAAYIAKVEQWLAPHLPAQPAVLDWGGGNGINTSTATAILKVNRMSSRNGGSGSTIMARTMMIRIGAANWLAPSRPTIP